MTASTETGVEGFGEELDNVTNTVTNTASTTDAPPAEQETTNDGGETTGGPMQPHDGYPSPLIERPPTPVQPKAQQ